jgi:hypothetical protein
METAPLLSVVVPVLKLGDNPAGAEPADTRDPASLPR